MVLKLQSASGSPGVGLKLGSKMCVSNMIPGDTPDASLHFLIHFFLGIKTSFRK